MSRRVGPARPRRAVAAALVVALLVALTATVLGCSDDGGDTTTATSDGTPPTLAVDTPSKDELSAATGLVFPPSTAGYRSVQLGPGQIDVLTTMAASEVDAFVEGSDLPALTDGQRTIAHPSPLWELNPTGGSAGTSATRDGVSIAVEVVGDGDPRAVRVSVIATDG